MNEAKYVFDVIFKYWFDIQFQIIACDIDKIVIEKNSKRMIFAVSFFKNVNEKWLKKISFLPNIGSFLDIEKIPNNLKNDSLKNIDRIKNMKIPILFFESNQSLIKILNEEKDTNTIEFNIDIFGTIFFFLSRYEEAILPDRDQHDRFPATASIAFKEGFLNRPIVNEYVELLWAMMKALWPELERKKRSFRMILTHDVDEPFEFYKKPPIKMVKSIGGDILKRHSINLALERYRQWNAIRKGNHTTDPFYSFDFIMKESEKRGLKSAFYFIADHTAGVIDGIYSLNDPEIINLMKTIDARCHEIGLHTSYNTYLDKVQTRKEAELLRAVMRGNSIHQEPQGGRQHYLRWKTPETFQNWEYAGMQYDSTLSFADLPGFRCGTCWEYPAYDLINRKPLNVIERPLIAMDRSVIAKRYMNKGYSEEAFEVFKSYKDTCRRYNGDFVLLWHNSELATEEQRRLYLSVLDS